MRLQLFRHWIVSWNGVCFQSLNQQKEADKIVLNKNGKKRYLSAQVTGSSKRVPIYDMGDSTPVDMERQGLDPLIEDRTIVGWTLTVPKGETVKIITKLTK